MSANDGKVRVAEVSTGIYHHYTLFENPKTSPLAPAVASSSISQQNHHILHTSLEMGHCEI